MSALYPYGNKELSAANHPNGLIDEDRCEDIMDWSADDVKILGAFLAAVASIAGAITAYFGWRAKTMPQDPVRPKEQAISQNSNGGKNVSNKIIKAGRDAININNSFNNR